MCVTSKGAAAPQGDRMTSLPFSVTYWAYFFWDYTAAVSQTIPVGTPSKVYTQICRRNGAQLKQGLWFSTRDWPRAAVELLHAVDLSEEDRLAVLQAVRPVVHAGHHPWAALRGTNGTSVMCLLK